MLVHLTDGAVMNVVLWHVGMIKYMLHIYINYISVNMYFMVSGSK